MTRYSRLPPSINIPEEEVAILNFWNSNDSFQTTLRQSKSRPRYTFFDGPPFATGLPHYGHILAGTIKDIITRYAHQSGYHVERRFGWDCHGLPVEYEVDKEYGIQGPEDVLKMGINSYNEKCRSIVLRYSAQWEIIIKRLGRWIDFKNDYRTMYPSFMESVWWAFKELFNKGLVYRGVKVMPFSTACATPLSNFEAGQNYRDVQDPAIIVSFPLDADPTVELIAWTTTPWTLTSNLALCVHPDKEYVKILDKKQCRTFILMKARLSALYREDTYEVLESFLGNRLEGSCYQPLFGYFSKLKQERGAFRVLCDTYVAEDVGTGVVHQSPYFGEDDFRICLTNGIIWKDAPIICPVDASGRFTAEVCDFNGVYVKDADKLICQHLKKCGRLVHQSTINHSYPYCWRSDTPLIYKAVPTWFLRVECLVGRLLENNAKSRWIPDFVREGRFANWLRDARDWAVSRNRFWGTPMPLWVSADYEEVVCVGSIEELTILSGVKVTDLHRECLDEITIPSRTGRGVLRRIPEVFDCWFESGSMPYAQLHYPFENTTAFNEGFPADFVAEGIDQTRGWFYTLLVLSTALFDKPPFKNVIVSGIILASDGQKMSKRLKNYPDPTAVIERHGADALRLYLINSPVVRAQNLRFSESGVHEVVKDVFLPWYNALRFLFESSLLPFEKVSGQTFMITPDAVPQTNNFMDRWILSFTQSLIAFVRAELAEYRLYTVVPRLVKFIDHLVNWYIRMNRRRLKGDTAASFDDWRATTHTLTYVLFQMTSLLSPFIPFLTEFLYQHLRTRIDFSKNLAADELPIGYDTETGAPKSVHYLPIPFPNAALIFSDIEEVVSWMQSVVELGRIIRTRANIPLKAPLRELVVIHMSADVHDKIKSAKDYIVEELNVRMLTVTSDKANYGVRLRAVLNHRILGSRLKHDYKRIVEAVKELSSDELDRFVTTGSITLCNHVLNKDDLSVVYTFGDFADQESVTLPKCAKVKDHIGTQPSVSPQCYEAASDSQGLLVLLDISSDPELEDERLLRELINRIQRTRKKAGLIPQDPIVIIISTNSASLQRVASPTHKLADLLQGTVKQPVVVTTTPNRPCNELELLSLGRSCISTGWELGHEIIHETVSIPPDDFELIFFSRVRAAYVESPPSEVPHGTLDNVAVSEDSRNAHVFVVCQRTGQQCNVLLSDSANTRLVLDGADLLRKVKCAFGWQRSIGLHLQAADDAKLDLLISQRLFSISGKTLYATYANS